MNPATPEVTALDKPGSNLPRRPAIDVSRLPESVLDDRSPVWVGNVLLVVIETVVFGLLVASLFYIRRNFDMWPPPRVNRMPVDLHPLPLLWASTANLFLLLASIAPMLYTDRRAKKLDESAT
jgi:heme/copper-type cytochrome/quinol oxidase subunit 3